MGLRHLILITLIVVNVASGGAQTRSSARRTRGVAAVFVDEQRLRDRADGASKLENFDFFLKPIEEVAKRDFPDIEFRVIRRGELLRLPDGTAVNVRNIQPDIGLVLSARGKKRRIISGVHTEVDFACAAATYFRRVSKSCPR